MRRHIVVSGDDALATTIVEELNSAGVSIVKLDCDELADTDLAHAMAVICDELSTQTRVIAITRPDEPVQLHPRRDARLRAADTVYLVGPYRELLATLRKGQLPQPSAAGDERRPQPATG